MLGGPGVLALVAEVRSELTGFGPLEPLLADPEVSDVLVNGPGEVWVDRGGGVARVDVRFRDEAAVRRLAQRLAAGWTEDHPGRFAYPAPPDFTGNAFVEQAFYGVTGEVERYQKPFDQGVFDERSPELYDFLEGIEPNLWREGETYPESSTKLDELYGNGEVWLTMSYNPQLAQRQVEKGLFPESTRTYLLEGGTLNNTHYLAIPFNGPNKAGAQVVANFLQSPEAQIKKQDPEGWGDPTALDIDRLPEATQRAFAEPRGKATLPTRVLQENRVPEARSGWLLPLEEGWQEKVLEE